MGPLFVRKNDRVPATFIPLIYAIAGGVLASVGAFIEEASSGIGFLLGLVVIGPLIEEILKPIGVIVLLEKKTAYLFAKTQIFWLCIVGAVIFAFLENTLYVYVYFIPLKHSNPVLYNSAVLYRYTVCILLHIITTSVVAMGLAREFVRIRRTGEKFLLENITGYIVSAVVIHGAYNLLTVILGPSLK